MDRYKQHRKRSHYRTDLYQYASGTSAVDKSRTTVSDSSAAAHQSVMQMNYFYINQCRFCSIALLVINNKYSMETRRPRIRLTYAQNNKRVKIDLVRFVKLVCEREKYISTKYTREQKRKDVLEEKKKPSKSVYG